jgi:hypothetical protein
MRKRPVSSRTDRPDPIGRPRRHAGAVRMSGLPRGHGRRRPPVRGACRDACRDGDPRRDPCEAPRAILLEGQGRLAQLVEHLVYTERVGGSSPSPPTSIDGGRPSLLARAGPDVPLGWTEAKAGEAIGAPASKPALAMSSLCSRLPRPGCQGSAAKARLPRLGCQRPVCNARPPAAAKGRDWRGGEG